MIGFALLFLVVVPTSDCAIFEEELCLFQAEINVDLEGSSHSGWHLAVETERKPDRSGRFNFTPRSAGKQNRPFTWEAVDEFQKQGLKAESQHPDDWWSMVFLRPPEHYKLRFIIPVIVGVLLCFALHSTLLYRMHKVDDSGPVMAGRLSIGPTESNAGESLLRGLASAVVKMIPIWPIIILESVGGGLVGPSDQYLNLDYFAKKNGSPSDSSFMCAVAPALPQCEKAVAQDMRVSMILGAVNPVVVVLLGPALGALSDSFGRRRIIVVCQFLLFLVPLFRSLYVFWGVDLAIAFWLTPLADIPLMGVLAAYFSDLVEDPRILAAMFGIMGAISCVGQLVGMLVGGHISIKLAYAIFIILKAVVVVYVCAFLPESLPRDRRAPFKWKYMMPGLSLGILVKTPLRRTLAAIVLMMACCDSGWGRVVPAYQVKYFNWDRDANYTCNIVSIVANMVWQGLLLPYVTSLIGDVGTLSIARWAGEFAGVGLLLSTQNWHHFLYSGAFFGPLSLAFPVIQALNSRCMSPHEQGRAQSSLNTVKSIFQAIGPPISGAIFEANRDKPQLQMVWRIYLLETCFNVTCIMLTLFLPKLLRELVAEERAAKSRRKVKKLPWVEGQALPSEGLKGKAEGQTLGSKLSSA